MEKEQEYLQKSRDSYCFNCGACDPINSYGVCFLCGKVPHLKTFNGFKKVIKGWFYWNLRHFRS
jgi:hypothetical protein